MSKRIIEIELIGDASKLEASFGKGAASATKFANETDKSSGKWSKFGTAAKAAALGGIGAVVGALKSSIGAAKEAQVSQQATVTQLKALGINYDAHAKQIDGVIQSTSKLAGIDDEDLQGAFTTVVRATKDVSSALRDTSLAADIARGKHIDVAAAATALAKVENGNVGVLKKLGIAYTPVTTAQDALKASTKNATAEQIAAAKASDATASKQGALAALQKTFGGQAEAYGKTAAGAQDRFKVAVENLQEAVGAGLLPILTRLAAIGANVAGYFEQHRTQALLLVGALGALGAALVAVKIASFASDVSALIGVIRAWTVVQTALDAVLTANPIGLVVVALAALGAALYLAYTKSETFRNIVNGAFHAVASVAKTAFDLVKTAAEYGLLGPVGLVITRWNEGKAALSTAWNAISSAAGTAWRAVKSNVIDPVADAVGFVRDKVGALVGFVGGRFGDVRDAVAKVGGGILSAMTSPFRAAYSEIAGIVGQIKGAVSSITSLPGKALHALHVPGFAGGTSSAPGGLALVGERGPELVELPRGSRVNTAGETAGMLAGAGGGQTVVNFNGPIGSQRAARVAAEQLAFRLRFG